MKVFSILKAIASGLIWGLGQLLNRQYYKALFFFLFFVLLFGIELLTSSYWEDLSAYDKLPGETYGDGYYQNFIAEYEFNKVYHPLFNPNPIEAYEAFDAYLEEVGVENVTEEMMIYYFAKSLMDNSPNTYTTLSNPRVEQLADDLDDLNRIALALRGTLYRDGNSIYYAERTNENNEKEYVETDFLTGETNESNILSSTDGLTTIVRNQVQILRRNNIFYLRVGLNTATNYIHYNLQTGTFYEETPGLPPITGAFGTVIPINGPLYLVDGQIMEYYQPGLSYAGRRMQYKETDFVKTFRQMVFNQYNLSQYDSSNHNAVIFRVYLETDLAVKEAFVENFDHFYYDRAGLFIRGYWGLFTLGTTTTQDYYGHEALEEAMITGPTGEYNLLNYNYYTNYPVNIRGHISVFVLLEALIGVLLSLFLFFFMFWSIRDAYKVSEDKRLSKKVLDDSTYFKDVYERGFEYIVLSPAIFVLAFISIMPILFGFLIAFTNIQGDAYMRETFIWVGFKNFVQLFSFSSTVGQVFGRAFADVLIWTIIWAIFSTATVFFGGFFQALILNSEKVVFRKLWRTILILPWAVPAILSQIVFRVMFGDSGFINLFLQEIGVVNLLNQWGLLGSPAYFDLDPIRQFFYLGDGRIQWFNNIENRTFVRTTIIVINIWLGFPYFMALMTGIMTAIDQTLYEAADIDGASKWQKITRITMPLVLYSTAPILIMTFSGNFNNFGIIYFVTGGGHGAGDSSRGFAGDTDILISWMYNLTVEHNILNMASVFSILIFLFVGSVTAWNLSRTKAFMED